MTALPTFTPSAANPEELDAVTVGREALFDDLVRRVQSAAREGSRPHTLLVAPRGGGKTHTLHVVLHRSLADAGTAKRILAVLIPEDSLAIGCYADLLVETARAIDGELGDTARTMRLTKDIVGIEQAIMAAAGERMVLLAIENLDRVFDALGQSGQGSLRAWVETSTQIMIFATAPMLFSGVSSRSYPWYGSFMVEPLGELSVDEGTIMLSRAARRRGNEEVASFVESSTGLERLRVIHRLAGGSPRLWHILSGCIDVASLDELVPAVEALLDRLAPYYQQRLWELPPGEQRLVVELARGWEPRTVGDLAAAVGVSNQSAATALGRLATSRWVTSTKARDGDKRASWYDVNEPLLRYHLQFREDRGKPLRLIVEFLRSFYSRERLLTELAAAQPGSQVERHLQRALFDSDKWFLHGSIDDPAALLASVRTWMLDDQAAYNDMAFALEAVLVAALGMQSKRAIPRRLQQVIGEAVVAQTNLLEPRDKVTASLQVLRRFDWNNESDDALTVFEFLCSATEFKSKFQIDPHCAAIRKRRISPPALMLRLLSAWVNSNDRPDRAIAELDDLLDDLADTDGLSESDRGLAWNLWLRTIPSASKPPSRKRAGTLDVGWDVVLAMHLKHIRPADLDRVMAAFTPSTQSVVAAVVAMGAGQLDIAIPAAHDPRKYVDDDLRSFIDTYVANNASESAARS